jgi:hypothetical protein
MADGLHIPIWNRTKKPFVNALSGMGRDGGGCSKLTQQIFLVQWIYANKNGEKKLIIM